MTVSTNPVPRYVEFSAEHASALTEFDRQVFRGYHEVPDDFYPGLFDQGARIMGHTVDEGERIVSLAVLLLQPSADPLAPRLERELPPWAGFLGGAGVDPDYRKSKSGLDLHVELTERRLELARRNGKLGLGAVLRSDNVSSMRNLLAQGLFMTGDAPNFYGTKPKDQRIVAMKWFDAANYYTTPRIQNSTTLQVRQNEGDIPQLRSLLRQGYLGYACLDAPDVDLADKRRSCITYFARLEDFPDDMNDAARSQLDEARKELQALCIDRPAR